MITPHVGQEHDVDVGGLLFTSSMVTIAEAGIQLDQEASFTGSRAGAEFTVVRYVITAVRPE